ncbi:MAG: hypothetical protein OEU50_11150 [Gammaproteobacteria bacterium]|nr:hypothetical protein [Gammaproteobacteria bacterium]
MTRLLRRLLILAAPVLLLFAAAPVHAADYDLNGLYVGTWTDKGRNRTNYQFKMQIAHDGDRISGKTVDKTVKIEGRLIVDIVKLEWDHSSGEYGAGYLRVLEGGRRLKGKWDSEGSGRFYGEWDLLRQ